MKKIVRSLAFALIALAAVPAIGQVTTDSTKTGIPNGTPTAITATTGSGSTMVLATSPTLSTPTLNTPTLSMPKLSTQTWASLPAAASNTWAVTVASDLGTNGALVASNGARWRPVNGEATLAQLGAQVAGIANSETIVLQTLIPAGAWQTNDTVRVWVNLTKSGTTDTLSFNLRVGTAGTTSDTAVVSSVAQVVAANQTSGFFFDLKLASATTVQRVGSISVNGSYLGGTSSAAPASTTISSASSNALYITVGISSSSTNNTVGIQSGHIQLVTP